MNDLNRHRVQQTSTKTIVLMTRDRANQFRSVDTPLAWCQPLGVNNFEQMLSQSRLMFYSFYFRDHAFDLGRYSVRLSHLVIIMLNKINPFLLAQILLRNSHSNC